MQAKVFVAGVLLGASLLAAEVSTTKPASTPRPAAIKVDADSYLIDRPAFGVKFVVPRANTQLAKSSRQLLEKRRLADTRIADEQREAGALRAEHARHAAPATRTSCWFGRAAFGCAAFRQPVKRG